MNWQKCQLQRSKFRKRFLTQELTMLKNTFCSYKIRIEMKTTTTTTTTTVIKNELKYSPMPEDKTCIAEPNLVVLPLK